MLTQENNCVNENKEVWKNENRCGAAALKKFLGEAEAAVFETRKALETFTRGEYVRLQGAMFSTTRDLLPLEDQPQQPWYCGSGPCDEAMRQHAANQCRDECNRKPDCRAFVLYMKSLGASLGYQCLLKTTSDHHLHDPTMVQSFEGAAKRLPGQSMADALKSILPSMDQHKPDTQGDIFIKPIDQGTIGCRFANKLTGDWLPACDASKLSLAHFAEQGVWNVPKE
jgi:hypothetical protein